MQGLPFNPQKQEAILNERFKDKFLGEACLIIGGGPSVNLLAPLIPCSLFNPYCRAGFSSVVLGMCQEPSSLSS